MIIRGAAIVALLFLVCCGGPDIVPLPDCRISGCSSGFQCVEIVRDASPRCVMPPADAATDSVLPPADAGTDGGR